jgi:hypothetical protein
MKARPILAGASGAVIAVIALAACSGSPAGFTVKGTVQDCTGTLSTGGQVTVADASGKILGSGTLTDDNSKAATTLISGYDALQAQLSVLGGQTSPGMSIYDFTVAALPGGQSRYGVSAGGQHGTVWFTPAEMSKGPDVSVGCS